MSRDREQENAEAAFAAIIGKSLAQFVGQTITPELIEQMAKKADTVVAIAPQLIENECDL